MNRKNMVGAGLCAFLFVGSFSLTVGIGAYWNLAAFLVVISGLLGAMLLSYPFERVKDAFKVAKNSYTSIQAKPEEIVNTLLDLAVRSRVDGVLSLEKKAQKTTSSFLRNGLTLLVDNYSEEEIRDFLTTEMSFFSLRRQQVERIFQTGAKIAPSFGVAGSVIGIIGLLMGIDDTGVILKTIPVAFISTLYGLVISNLVMAPIAENINFSTRRELLNQKMIMEGIIAISKEQNPYKLEKKLASFMSPCQREGKAEALRRITRKYIKEKKEAKIGKEELLKEGIVAKAS